MTSWYAVYTLPGWEKKIAENLSKKGFENYYPQVKTNVSKKVKKQAYVPLFKSYVFVKAEEQQISHLQKLSGVISLLYWLEKPVKIKEIEIEMIKRFLIEHKNVQLEKTSVATNSIVKITSVSSMDEGNDVLGSYNIIKLLLPSIGYQIVATVAKEMEALGTTKQIISNIKISSGSEVEQ